MRWDSEDEMTHIVEPVKNGDFKMTRTPFEQGKIDGQWTAQQVRECGFTSAQECLEHQEQVYRDEVACLPALRQQNAEYATRQAQYLEGLIATERETLRQLMK
jgi:hypothetical protein